MYIVKEEYGFYYESSNTYVLGYTESLEEAEAKKEELESTHRKYEEYQELENNLYDEMISEGTDEEYEAYDKASKYLRESMGLEECSSFNYDYYWVKIEEIKHL